jgi:Uma2 family endonuclease
MSTAVEHIPEVLIYEMVKGKPIYYKGYKDYINGIKQIEELMGSSKLQALIIAELIYILRSFLEDDYLIFTNELGLQFSKSSWRAADIAVIKSDLIDTLDNKYLDVPPNLVIEIDTRAELLEVNNPLGYYQEKTDDLLEFGVGRVLWIFTDTQKVLTANRGENWLISNWTENVELINGLNINLAEIINKRLKQ